jgi:hypothetical protein
VLRRHHPDVGGDRARLAAELAALDARFGARPDAVEVRRTLRGRWSRGVIAAGRRLRRTRWIEL